MSAFESPSITSFVPYTFTFPFSALSNIRFIGAVDFLPRLTEDMIGEVYLLKCGSTMETYVAISDNLGQLSWQQLNSTEV